MDSRASRLLFSLDAEVSRWHLLKHPFYQDWQAGRLDRGALQLYAAQYYRHVEAFPRHLRCLAARADGGLRELIEENLAEEENPHRSHPKLWRDFASAVGVTGVALSHSAALPGTQALVVTYGRICAEHPLAEAVAALYAYEAQVPEIARQKIEGLRRFYGVTEPKGLSYFAVHEEADVRHRAAWRGWLMQKVNGSAEGVLRTAEEALRALWGGLDAVYTAHA
jgi:pyrroloquinoline-quinone synthase